jgi:argininosuccinate lyase
MNIEAALRERIGEAADRLHTARSRNDQVATDVRLYLKEAIGDALAALRRLQGALEGWPTARHHARPHRTFQRRSRCCSRTTCCLLRDAGPGRRPLRDCSVARDELPRLGGRLSGVPSPHRPRIGGP